MTEKEAKRIDLLEKYNITERDFNAHKDELRKKFGGDVSDRDVVWSVWNERILNNIHDNPSIKDLAALEQTYYDMAMFLIGEGKDCFDLLQQRSKMRLMRLKHYGNKVRISCSKSSCESCRQLVDKIFTVEEAIDSMPIPFKGCTNTYCACTYLPEPYLTFEL